VTAAGDNSRHSICAEKSFVSFHGGAPQGVINRHRVFVPVIIADSGRMNERDGKSLLISTQELLIWRA